MAYRRIANSSGGLLRINPILPDNATIPRVIANQNKSVFILRRLSPTYSANDVLPRNLTNSAIRGMHTAVDAMVAIARISPSLALIIL